MYQWRHTGDPMQWMQEAAAQQQSSLACCEACLRGDE
jgi:hypothetical protein